MTDQQKARAEERKREKTRADQDRERDLDANKRQFDRAVAEIPNPGSADEPLVELQAFHTKQTDPPPGPYPDPPPGPYPDPVIKDRPTEEAVYGRKPAAERRTRAPENVQKR